MYNSKQYRLSIRYECITCLFDNRYLVDGQCSPIFITLLAFLRLASLFMYCDCASGGSWEKLCGNPSVTKVTCTTFNSYNAEKINEKQLFYDLLSINAIF